jgi:hypothetical protein
MNLGHNTQISLLMLAGELAFQVLPA